MKIDIHFETPALNMLTTLVEGGFSPWFGHIVGDFNISPADDFNLTVMVDDPDGEEGKFDFRYEITRFVFERGCQYFVDNYPRHLADMLSENDDADTADVFWQCIIFNEVIYA